MTTQAKALPSPREALRVLESPVNAVLIARAHAQVEREKMDAIDRELLRVWKVKDSHTGEPITEPSKAWHMAEEYWDDYHADREREIERMGYKIKKGYCPALVAEGVVRLAERTLIEAAQEWFPDCTPDRLLCAGLDKYRRYIELLIGMVVSLSDYKKPNLRG